MADANRDLNVKESITKRSEAVMSATNATIASPPPRLRAEQQKVFPKPKKIPGTAAKPDQPKLAVPCQTTSELGVTATKTFFRPTLTLTGALTMIASDLNQELKRRSENYETAQH